MDKLIEALQFIKQFMMNPDNEFPTACEHEILYVCDVDLSKMTAEDVRKLHKLGFMVGDRENDNYCLSDEDGIYTNEYFDPDEITEEQWKKLRDNIDTCVSSYKYGSC
jgi:hypothetical protein